MLSFNKTTEYSFRIMSYVASDANKLYTSDDIYEELKIPFRYLRRLLTKLSNAGLLDSIQGKYGGFRLTKDLKDIRLYDIYKASEESTSDTSCFFGFPTCPSQGNCIMHDAWTDLRLNLLNVLKNTSLAELKSSDIASFLRKNSQSSEHTF